MFSKFIENQKLSGKEVTSRGRGKMLEKMYKDLRELRLQVDQLKRKILVDEVQTTKDDEMLKRLNKYIDEELRFMNSAEYWNNKKRA